MSLKYSTAVCVTCHCLLVTVTHHIKGRILAVHRAANSILGVSPALAGKVAISHGYDTQLYKDNRSGSCVSILQVCIYYWHFYFQCTHSPIRNNEVNIVNK